MNKKQIVALSFLLVITLGLAAGASYLQQTHSVQVNTQVKKYKSQRDSAVSELEQHDASNNLLLKSTNDHVQELQTKNVGLCALVVKSKITTPLCQ